MQPARGRLDLVPLQIAHLGRPQATPEGDQDHCGIAVPVPATLQSHRHQRLDLGPGQILARPFNCGIYDGWCRLAACLRIHEKCPAKVPNCGTIAHFFHSLQRGKSRESNGRGTVCPNVSLGRKPTLAMIPVWSRRAKS
jgi:hypothetical protein